MSYWQFILIDEEGNETESENPRGWDAIQVKLTRDKEVLGIFFDYLIQTLEFYGVGAQTIKAAYEAKRLKASMKLRINFFCSEDAAWDKFYEGRLAFPRYEDTCGDLCIVRIGLEQNDDVMLLRNNYEQNVNLNSNIAFDGITVLTDYDKLNTSLTIPGRGIPLTSRAVNAAAHSFDLLSFPTWSNISGAGSTGTENGGLLPIFDTTQLAEFQTTSFPVEPYYDTSIVFNDEGDSVGPPPILNLSVNPALKCQPSDTSMRYRLKGRLIDNTNASRSVGMNANISIGPDPSNVINISSLPLVSYDAFVFLTSEFDVSFDSPININEGDKVYFYMQIGYLKTSSNALQQLIIEFDPETNIEITGVSRCEDSEANVYFINEAVGRITEAITNDRIRFYSETFGRLDSQPYTAAKDTCGGLKAIVNGLNLRRKTLANGAQPDVFISLRNAFEALRAMWNIGYGIEPDIHRPGFNYLRFEDWRYFFQDEVGLVFNNATSIRRTVDTTRAYTSLQVGYTKWENEQYSGLNEFMTEREYRNDINSVAVPLDRRTSWILASYTAELARRQDTTSNDYRYDNDMFGFCLKKEDGDYSVEQLIDNGSAIENIPDPDTCYNARVSPARVAMRWFNTFMQPIANLQVTDKMHFTKGTGNYVAKFALDGECEIAAAPLQENKDIVLTDFYNQQEGAPVVYAEILTFDHPMNYSTFARIKNMPSLKYKSIRIKCNDAYLLAWIADITYTPNRGLATIITWPKNSTQLPGPPPPFVCEATIVPDSVTMENWDFEEQSAEIDFTEGAAGATLWYYIVTQGDTPGAGTGFSGTTTVHPFTVNGITAGQWSVMVVPYCDEDNVGQNYAAGTFTFEAPPLNIQLRVTYGSAPGSPLKQWYLNVEPVGTAVFPFGFSFQFGGCYSQPGFSACNGYPGASNPGLAASVNVTAGMSSVVVKGPGNMSTAGSVTSVTLFNKSGITNGQIAKVAGQTWTLNFI